MFSNKKNTPHRSAGQVTPTQSSDFEDDPLDYSKVYPDFTVDQIQEMNKSWNMFKTNHSNGGGGALSPMSMGVGDGSCTSTDLSTVSLSRQTSLRNSITLSPSSSDDRGNIWSTLIRRGYNKNLDPKSSAFDDETSERTFDEIPFMEKVRAFFAGLCYELRLGMTTLCKYPHIIFFSFLFFAGLCSASLYLVGVIQERNQDKLANEAKWEAMESGIFFSEMFAKSLIPLRSLQQAVVHSTYFRDLPSRIGNYGEVGSAPAIVGPRSNGLLDYRNVTGICDDEELAAKFQEIVLGINANFEYDGIIVNYRLAPYGVFCVVDPLINVKDFSEDAPMNSTMDIGWDPIHSSNTRWGRLLRDIYKDTNHIDIFGPMFDFVENGVEMYCGHLAVHVPGYNYTVDGEYYSTWGFVMHFIHWSNLKEASGIDYRFRDRGMHYLLTRRDLSIDPVTGKELPNDVVIATNIQGLREMRTEDPVGIMDGIYNQKISAVSIQTANGEWIMRVVHDRDVSTQYIYIRIATVLCVALVTIMFSMILLERQLHKLLLYKIMPLDAIRKLNRGETVVERYNIVTIFFSDIVGFTSMAGEMRPMQVMKMLNELYTEFDKIAEKNGVYKVETIGDAYMVVGGAPERIPAPKAAQRVALFALETLEFVKNFRTSEGHKIHIRAGIASGPVVAGVVGKAMPRYCFFGDTVNLASRMESSSKKMKIQCSDFTRQLIQDAPDFSFEIEQREENGVKGVDLKGKGLTNTWWIRGVSGLHFQESVNGIPGDIESRQSVHVDVIIQSMVLSGQSWSRIGLPDSPLVGATSDQEVMITRVSAMLQHRLEIAMEQRRQGSMNRLQKSQLRSYVKEISTMYNPVDFHNFEHAVHVTTSMNKIIDTIVESVDYGEQGNGSICKTFWQNSFIHFTLIFSCLIHDVEHTGKSNKILAANQHRVAIKFTGPSAERNSIQVALELLFRPKYKFIRKAIFPRIEDRFLFGKCIFWAILCTDIASPENTNNCLRRFNIVHAVRDSLDSAIARGIPPERPNYNPDVCPLLPYLKEVVAYLKLTQKEINDNPEQLKIDQCGIENCVAVEHLMQGSDVAHLMQDWSIFLKFNYRLYKELMACYKSGLMPDPSGNWAIGQIGFFTHYVIPLAERIETICGGSISSLHLSQNARANMNRWQEEGELLTGIFVSGYRNCEAEEDILRSCLSSDNNLL
mmetsp:Transcript_15384/g.28983  ORF Transcript_15384/g.28983 Transcript_15384/m.28983 type:complete len:1197 (+) Transcript_15384:315-3905(+)